MPIFSFGTLSEINSTWTNLYNIMLISYFIGIAFLIYNMILYFITKDKSFIHYSIYIFGLLLVCLSGRSYIPFDIIIEPQILRYILIVAITISGVGLTLFTNSFLGLKERLPLNAKILNIISIFFCLMSLIYFLFDVIVIKILFLISFYFLSIYPFYVAFKIYKKNYIVGLHFLFSTGIGTVFISLFMMTFYTTEIIPINIWNITLVNQALIWDVIALSLALAYRIKLLQTEKIEKEKMLVMQSRQVAVGEFASNVSHQWKQPLTQLSALIAKLEVEIMFNRKIEINELKDFIISSNKTIKHLSSTIDVFQSFYQEEEIKQTFSIAEQLQRCIEFTKDAFKHESIKIKLTILEDCHIKGDPNLFTQVILNLLSNSKDAFKQSNQAKKFVKLSLNREKDFIHIAVEDNAGGIQIKPIEKIFEPYITTKGLNGMGIGLFIIRNIIQQKFGGKINASNIKDGASFVIIL